MLLKEMTEPVLLDEEVPASAFGDTGLLDLSGPKAAQQFAATGGRSVAPKPPANSNLTPTEICRVATNDCLADSRRILMSPDNYRRFRTQCVRNGGDCEWMANRGWRSSVVDWTEFVNGGRVSFHPNGQTHYMPPPLQSWSGQ